jgi:2-polyprenyl-3-methyl-5-hydroxy-6-metoxy-1,4-benzoquinol methylase
MHLQGVVDSPQSGSSWHRQRILIEGWVYGDYRHERLKRVSAHAPGGEIGATRHFYVRNDVTEANRLAVGTRTGFRFLGCFADAYRARGPVGIEVRVEFSDGTVIPLAGIHVTLLENDFTGAPYGDLCNPDRKKVLHRDDLYLDNPPPDRADPDCIKLLTDYLPPRLSIVDVNCGPGVYCEPLRSRGYSWLGCEASIDYLHQLALHSRPHRAIRKPLWPWSTFRLPAADGEFDAALAFDVLEHVTDLDLLLREMARVTRRYAFFSVPNLATLPFLADRRVAPWHLLSRDHVNFFTRFNLQPLLQKHFRSVELLDCGSQPLSSPEGLPLPYQLFAMCEV